MEVDKNKICNLITVKEEDLDKPVVIASSFKIAEGLKIKEETSVDYELIIPPLNELLENIKDENDIVSTNS